MSFQLFSVVKNGNLGPQRDDPVTAIHAWQGLHPNENSIGASLYGLNIKGGFNHWEHVSSRISF